MKNLLLREDAWEKKWGEKKRKKESERRSVYKMGAEESGLKKTNRVAVGHLESRGEKAIRKKRREYSKKGGVLQAGKTLKERA